MNPGVIVPVMKKTRFEYSYLGASTSQSVIIEPEINFSSFYYYKLIVRVHDRSFAGSQTITVGLYNTLPSDEDPREFSDTTTVGAVTITGASPSVPGILSVSGTDPGAYMKLLLTASQPVAPGILYAELSAVLVLRSA
jgi:hypothetical protein